MRGPLVTITITIRCWVLIGGPHAAKICQRASGSLLVDFDPVAFLGSWAPYLIWELVLVLLGGGGGEGAGKNSRGCTWHRPS